MTPEVRKVLQDSWALVSARADVVAACFYARLFEIDPTAAELFADTDMAAQRRKFTDMLGAILRALGEPRQLVPGAAALARRHAAYGVDDHHYASVGDALLLVLAESLGDAFTPDVRAGWVEAYALLASLMRRAAARTTDHRTTDHATTDRRDAGGSPP